MQKTLSKSQYRKFGMTLSVFFVGIFAGLVPWLTEQSIPLWPFMIACALGSCALVLPSLLRYVYTPWMKVGHVLGWINTRIILSLIYFLVITPLGVCLRCFKHDPMAKKYDQNVDTYRQKTQKLPPQHMERPF